MIKYKYQKKHLPYIIGIALLLLIIIIKIFKKMNMIMISPVPIAKITSPFGNRIHPITKQPQFHNGVDIGLPSGTEIKAPFDAVVDTVAYNDIGGNNAILKLKNGFTVGFAHMLKPAIVKKGEAVKQGQVIGYVGSTGRSTGSHLHLTLKNEKGELVNPVDYIKLV